MYSMAPPKNKDRPKQDAASSAPGRAHETVFVVTSAEGHEIRIGPDHPRAAQIAQLLRFS
jgi:hypothetical protein